MNQNKQNAIGYIEQNQKQYTDISHRIWSFAELSLKEFQSAALYVEALKNEGFTVETGLSGIETAFLGSFTVGEGGPVIGILGEFDALSGLSQKACSTVRQEIDAFVGDAPQFDDITMLGLYYKGGKGNA